MGSVIPRGYVDGVYGVKRDKDLLIEVLGRCIRDESGEPISGKALLQILHDNAQGPYTPTEIEYHMWLLQNVGFAEISNYGGRLSVAKVTWAGHDFYESESRKIRPAK
jgi:hypothetical protein